MDVYRTEEEQVAVLKKWWKDNGSSLLIGIVIALVVIFGWKMYQKKVEADQNAASRLYQQLLTTSMKEKVSDEDRASIKFIANKLKQAYSDEEYGVFASLFLAKTEVEQGKLDLAEKELVWALAHQTDEGIVPAIKTRLARIIAAQGRVDEAIAMIDEAVKLDVNNDFTGIYMAVKGDLYLKKGMKSEAISAYQAAYSNSIAKKQQAPIIKMKLADLGVLAGDA